MLSLCGDGRHAEYGKKVNLFNKGARTQYIIISFALKLQVDSLHSCSSCQFRKSHMYDVHDLQSHHQSAEAHISSTQFT